MRSPLTPCAWGGIYIVNTNFNLPRTFYYLIKRGGVGRHVQFDGKLNDTGELYGRLNGRFKLYYPKISVTIAEETDAREIHCWEPKIPKEKWGRQYFIVPYLTAVIYAI